MGSADIYKAPHYTYIHSRQRNRYDLRSELIFLKLLKAGRSFRGTNPG